MRRTPLFDKNVRKTEFISLPQPHHTLHQQTNGGDARPAAGSQQQRFSPALYQLDPVYYTHLTLPTSHTVYTSTVPV